MNTATQIKYKPAPTIVRHNGRDLVQWSRMSISDLRKTIDLLDRHASPHLGEAVFELQRRYSAGLIDLLDAPLTPPPPRANVPHWLYKWPFCLLWKQRPR